MGLVAVVLFYVLKILLRVSKAIDGKSSSEESENIIKRFNDQDKIPEATSDEKKLNIEDIASLDQEIRELLTQHRTVMTEFEYCVAAYGKNSALMLFTMSYSPNITTDQFLENIYENKSKFI